MHGKSSWGIVWIGAVLCAGQMGAQPGVTELKTVGQVEGTVVNAVTGEAVPRAVVRWTGSRPPQKKEAGPQAQVRTMRSNFQSGTVTADENGAFRFDAESGMVVLTATKAGYSQRGESHTARVTGEGKGGPVTLRLAPFGVVAGKVTDFYGEGVGGLTVQLLDASVSRGERRLMESGSGTTDDQGEYRLWHLEPGEYYLRVLGRNSYAQGAGELPQPLALAEAYAPVYYAAAGSVAEAQVLQVKSGQTVTADLRLLATQVYSIRGRMEGYVGGMRPGLRLLKNGEEMGAVVQIDGTSGAFQLLNVPAGHYELQGWTWIGKQMLFGRTEVTVTSGALRGVTVALRAGSKLRIPKPPSATEEGVTQVDLVPVGADGQSEREGRPRVSQLAGRQDAELEPVFEGLYRCEFTSYGTQVSAARQGSRDVLREGVLVGPEGGASIELTMTAATGELEVRLPEQEKGKEWTVGLLRGSGFGLEVVALVAPTVTVEGPRRVLEAGVARFSQLQPGTYRVIAWRAGQEPEYRKPAVLALVDEQARQVTVGTGGEAKVEAPLWKPVENQ